MRLLIEPPNELLEALRMRQSPTWARIASRGRPRARLRTLPATQPQSPGQKLQRTPAEEEAHWLTRPLNVPGAHDRRRIDITSPELCNEAIDLIQATGSLPPPASCDVIDLNPGICVWSKALHKALKPRRHVLIEAERDTYAHAIDPLLADQGSHYRHAPSVLDAFDLRQDLLSPELREYHTNIDPAEKDHVRYSHNKHLIITANLAGRVVTTGHYQGFLSKLFIDAFQRSIAFDTGHLHANKYGLIKLLAWIPETEKYSIVPRCTGPRFRTSRMLEAACHIREIVSSFPNHGQDKVNVPWHGAAIQSMQEVAQNQSKSGINVPDHRKQPEPQPPSAFYSADPANVENLRSLERRPPLVDQYITTYGKIQKEHSNWFKQFCEDRAADLRTDLRSPKPDRLPHHDADTDFPPQTTSDDEDIRRQYITFRNRMTTTHNQFVKVDEHARRMIALERELTDLRRENPDDKTPYLVRLKELKDSGEFTRLEAIRQKFFKDNRHRYLKALDDYRSLLPQPHVLAWHNRTFEPLLCHPKTDFTPHQPMTLVEVTPKEEFVRRINTSTRWICFDFIVHQLDQYTHTTVKRALEKLIGEDDAKRYQDFVDSIPSLTDPLYGGHHDLGMIRCRTLPMDTVIDIALAYEKYPFRKDEAHMVTIARGGHNLARKRSG